MWMVFDGTKPRRYQYSPLEKHGQIRLLRLLGDDVNGTLRCSIIHTTLSSDARFAALSYVWGDPIRPYKMLTENGQYIPLTKSLHDAMKDLRSMREFQDKLFWIDQISINQEDNEERGQQVTMMNEIFRSAGQVITYIGSAFPGSTHGIKLLDELQMVWGEISQMEPQLNFRNTLSFLNNRLLNTDDMSWKALVTLISREWSNRTWMIQENLVNPETFMVCGGEIFRFHIPSLVTLGATFATIPDHYRWVLLRNDMPENRVILHSHSTWELLYLRAWFTENACKSQALLDLLRASRSFSCRDARDRVYAVLGLASDHNLLYIQLDYFITPEQVFTETAIRILQSSNKIDLFDCIQHPKEFTHLPSWIPDWSRPLARCLIQRNVHYNASRSSVSTVSFNSSRTVLIISGAILDTIRHASPAPSINGSLLLQHPEVILTEYSNAVDALTTVACELGYDTYDTVRSPPELLDLLASAIMAGQLPWYIDGAKSSATLFQEFMNSCRALYDAATENQDRDANADSDAASSIGIHQLNYDDRSKFMGCTAMAEGRSLCVSDDNRLVLAPSSTRVGDKVAILLGGKTVYILRPTGGDKEDEEEFELVGEAYAHGVMNGEMMDDPAFVRKIQRIQLR